ncbi:hypothetical protein BCR32DRAFT_103135 [Anaeromyces robustus]|uniref:VTC domain-containing protein n=1 Tax=Anaeromyces robustus TaxID=1754192 RepID=A0A1Y1XHA9_9FUNG|nr:hypothetical protein BCR32DRAFT_103135 [Anaeromyces robustus]|eukprot:ORX85130.1 hypothetical protein BCR32DRAFT_103135 [Anaeromyces robustus]
MKPINFPVFLIEYNQSKTNGWVDKYVSAETFKFLFLNQNKEINVMNIKEKCANYDELYNLISQNFEKPTKFLKEKLNEIHNNIQRSLDKTTEMKSKIEGNDFSEEAKLMLDTNTINDIVSEIQSAKDNNNNNYLKLVSTEEDPLASSNQNSNFDNIDKLDSPLPAHFNNNNPWANSSNNNYSESSPFKIKLNSDSIKKSKHRYSTPVSNPNVQSEFWKDIFYKAERKNLEICLLEKYAFSHRRLLENIIKAVEMLFKYQPSIFTSDDIMVDLATERTAEEYEAFKTSKNNFIKRIEEDIWSGLWLSKSIMNICLLKLSKLYDEIRNSEKFYLDNKKKNNSEGDESNNNSSADIFYHNNDFNNSNSSLQNNNNNNNSKGNNTSSDKPSKKKNVDNKSFVRKSIKYWIHPDYVTEVKSIILRHLPIYVFGGNHDLDHPKNPLISSVYYDNHQLELYHHRIHKSHLAIAFRYRWYGDLKWNHQMSDVEYLANQSINKSEVFAERKTHKEDWTGDNSIKERFSIDPSKINDFNRGQYIIETTDNIMNKPKNFKFRSNSLNTTSSSPLKNKGNNEIKDGKETQQQQQQQQQKQEEEEEEDYFKKNEKLMAKVALANEIQTTIIDKQLRPTMRTIYNRTAFQLPDDQRIRISLDTELTFVREDLKAKKGEWKRDDVGIHWPYRHLTSSEKYLFPYAVLEVKLQTQFGQEPPQWINELTTSYLVEAVPKFSKFMHGCAMLIPEKVKVNPYWFYRMYDNGFDLRSPLNVATLRETTMCPVKMPWNMNTIITNFDIISPTLRRSITSRSNRIQRPTRREPKLSFANERLFLKYFKIGILVCNVSIVIYYFGNPFFGISYTFAGLLFILYGHRVYRFRERLIQHNPKSLPLDSMSSIYVISSVLIILFIFNLINIYSGRYSTSNPAKLDHLQNNNVIDHRH